MYVLSYFVHIHYITTIDSVIIAGLITARIRRIGSDDLSLPVLGSENQKIIGGVTQLAVMTTIIAGLYLQPVVAGRTPITAG
jgi:hypothetical protein